MATKSVSVAPVRQTESIRFAFEGMRIDYDHDNMMIVLDNVPVCRPDWPTVEQTLLQAGISNEAVKVYVDKLAEEVHIGELSKFLATKMMVR